MTWPRRWHVKLTRDTVLFAVGAVLLWHETFAVDTSEPILVAVAVAFMGSPLFLRLDEVSRGKAKDDAK